MHHCVTEPMKWPHPPTGLTSVIFVFHQASQDLVNSTVLHALSHHDKRHRTQGRHVFEVEGEGKSSGDSLGVALKRVIRNICSHASHTRTLFMFC